MRTLYAHHPSYAIASPIPTPKEGLTTEELWILFFRTEQTFGRVLRPHARSKVLTTRAISAFGYVAGVLEISVYKGVIEVSPIVTVYDIHFLTAAYPEPLSIPSTVVEQAGKTWRTRMHRDWCQPTL